MSPTPDPSDWRTLYRVGGICAASVVLIIAIQMAVFFVWPPPLDGTVSQWFNLFQGSWLRGLLDMDLLMVVDYVLLMPMYLALFVALRRVNQSWMLVATTLLVLGAAAFFASNPSFEMLSLSARHAAAADDSERRLHLAAGQVMLESWEGTAFDVAYVLGAVGVLIVSSVMLRSSVFSKSTAHVGLAMGITSLVPASAGSIGLVMSLLSLIPTVCWLSLVGVQLVKSSSFD